MKKYLLPLMLLGCFLSADAQWKPFRFAFLSDVHISAADGAPVEDLKRSINDINNMNDIDFVVITGDITELGTDEEIHRAKSLFDGLKVKWYIIPGNHDAGWSESGGVTFGKVFGYDKFNFEHNGIHFLGCPSGPYVRMSDGHIPRDAVNWLDGELKKIGPKEPIIFLNHYPMDNALDNWYEAVDRLKQHNTLAILCGHGHNNHALNFEGIPGIMGRSNLRAKAAYGGYNLVDVRADSMVFSERTPGVATKSPWARVKLEFHQYAPTPASERPSYHVNDSFPAVHAKWTYGSDANVISTPAIAGRNVVFGNFLGTVEALSITNGKKQWSYQTKGAIYSSPAVQGEKVVLGSGDGNVYCLNAKTGKLIWQHTTGAAVLGCPLISNNVVYIGGSDHHFRALELATGIELWSFDGLEGPVVSTPVLSGNTLVFGAWDRHLYALNAIDGKLIWKWDNGSPVRNFSPASVIPVIQDNVVYIVAPDRYLSAIDLTDGKTLWRTKEGGLRESLGVSADGRYLYGKSMNDTIVAFPATRQLPPAAWKMGCGFGYEHVPSMLIEKDNTVFFGTKNGKVYAIDPRNQSRVWTYKIDNSMVNTVNVISGKQLIASTMDGKVAFLETK